MGAKYDRIGFDYDKTRKADTYLFERLLHHLSPKKGKVYLDIGCGTGNYTNRFHQRGHTFIGIDPSVEMLTTARHRNPEIEWKTGTAEKTGLASRSVYGIIATLTIHHWTCLKTGFTELGRILHPGGKIVLFTSTPEQMNRYWLTHYFPKMMADSIHQMPTLKSIEKAMEQNKFALERMEKYFVKSDLQDKFLYCGKQDPKLYLDQSIRQGISSFSSLANRAEVEKGLNALKIDIKTGTIKQIIKSYENDLGDYLFLVGRSAA